jgi:low affinity Fe/Cu permease
MREDPSVRRRALLRTKGGDVAKQHRLNQRSNMHLFFTDFSDWAARWTGSHWAVFIAAAFVLIGLLVVGIEVTNLAISIVTLLMVFVLQNTQNRDSAGLQLKLDEMVRVEPDARDALVGVESKTHGEIKELSKEDTE